MRPLSDYLFALAVGLISGGGWYLAHWSLLRLIGGLKRRVAS